MSNKVFDKAAFGYRTDDVDRYIEQQDETIRTLEAEQADLQKKMKVLAEKINEYRQDENSLKEALIGAQKMRNAIIKEAQGKADAMLMDAKKRSERLVYDAQHTADETIGSVRAQVEHEKLNLAKMQKAVADFKSKLLSLYKIHLNAISSMPDMEKEYETVYQQAGGKPQQEETPAAPEVPAEPAAPSETTEQPAAETASAAAPAEEPAESAANPSVSKPNFFEEKFGDLKLSKK